MKKLRCACKTSREIVGHVQSYKEPSILVSQLQNIYLSTLYDGDKLGHPICVWGWRSFEHTVYELMSLEQLVYWWDTFIFIISIWIQAHLLQHTVLWMWIYFYLSILLGLENELSNLYYGKKCFSSPSHPLNILIRLIY